MSLVSLACCDSARNVARLRTIGAKPVPRVYTMRPASLVSSLEFQVKLSVCCLPMIIRAGGADVKRMSVPKIIRMILPFAIQRSLEAAFVLRNARAAIAGSIMVNKIMFTPARKDKSSPAYGWS